MEKIKFIEFRAHLTPLQHLKGKQDGAIPSSRHVRKDMSRHETRARHKPSGGLPKTKENNVTAQGRQSGRIKLPLPEYLREFPEPNGLEARWDRGRVRYGADRAPENAGPRPFYPPCPAQRPGAGCLSRHSLPPFALRPPPHPYPGRVPAKNGW